MASGGGAAAAAAYSRMFSLKRIGENNGVSDVTCLRRASSSRRGGVSSAFSHRREAGFHLWFALDMIVTSCGVMFRKPYVDSNDKLRRLLFVLALKPFPSLENMKMCSMYMNNFLFQVGCIPALRLASFSSPGGTGGRSCHAIDSGCAVGRCVL